MPAPSPRPLLLSIDWDAFSGTRELVFDAPIWGTRDREEDRLEAWRRRARKRGGEGWEGLAADFPLYPGWEALKRYAGVPTHVTLTHADAWAWLEAHPGAHVLNVDSHHDLASLSGNPTRVRPGNWAGLALASGRARHYTCLYPEWHANLPVAEGYDLERTRGEVAPLLAPGVLARVTLTRGLSWPEPTEVAALLLVQSPAWTNPAHDPAFVQLMRALGATPLTPPLDRSAAR